MSAKKLQSAIDDIVKANNRVDLEEGDTAAYHFNGEQIKEGNFDMQDGRHRWEELCPGHDSILHGYQPIYHGLLK